MVYLVLQYRSERVDSRVVQSILIFIVVRTYSQSKLSPGGKSKGNANKNVET